MTPLQRARVAAFLFCCAAACPFFASASSFERSLAIGSRGQDVAQLQTCLISQHFLSITSPTGFFGPLTEASVRRFQEAHDLEQVGIVGPKTRALLNALLVPQLTMAPQQTMLSLRDEVQSLLEKIASLKASQQSAAAPAAIEHEPLIPAPPSQPRAEPPIPQGDDFIANVEAGVHARVNQERLSQGVSPLTWNSTLAGSARSHSEDMARAHYFDHTDTSGCSSSCRIGNSGYEWSAVAENIYMMSGYQLSADATAEKIVDSWMESPGHRANILNESLMEEGIGLAREGDALYATEDLASPK